MPTRRSQVTTLAVAALLIALAVVRLAFHSSLATRMDVVFLGLIGAALLILLVPIERWKSLKAGGIELSLDQPQVQGAIAGLGLDRIENAELRARLTRLQHQLGVIRGSRVLWIDDRPHTILGERRLLRALGAEVVQATSSDTAERILETDNDFDLIITDVQRVGESYRQTGGNPIHEGVNFIVKLGREGRDPVVTALPVIFYAAYPRDALVEWTRPAWEHSPSPERPKPEIANSAIDLIPKAVTLLAQARSTPLTVSAKKPPTAVATQDDEAHEGDEEEHVGEEEEHAEEELKPRTN